MARKEVSEIGVNVREIHGMTNHPLYRVWRNMKNRCLNPNHPQFRHYGGRGIGVCDRWRSSFVSFMQDMGPSYVTGRSIDRIDNNGSYTPENCRWATHAEQQSNRRCTLWAQTENGSIELKRVVESLGIKYDTAIHRRLRGCSQAQVLAPVGEEK